MNKTLLAITTFGLMLCTNAIYAYQMDPCLALEDSPNWVSNGPVLEKGPINLSFNYQEGSTYLAGVMQYNKKMAPIGSGLSTCENGHIHIELYPVVGLVSKLDMDINLANAQLEHVSGTINNQIVPKNTIFKISLFSIARINRLTNAKGQAR